MAQYEGTVPVTGTITPVDTKDEYPIVSSEHIKGGYRPVSTKANLTKIPIAHLVPGSLALVVDERKFYYYNPKLDEPWAILDISGSGLDQEALKAVLDDYYNKLEIDRKLEAIPILDPLTLAKKTDILEPDNDTVYEEEGKLKAKQLNVDNASIIKTPDGTLQVAQDLLNEIARLSNAVDNGIQTNPDTGKVSVKVATALTNGIVRPDNTTITINQDGVLSTVNKKVIATPVNVGLVKPDNLTLQVGKDGTLSLKNPTSKLGELTDVDADNITGKAGYALCVNDTETGFILRQTIKPVNKTITIDVDSNNVFTLVYDFHKHFNVALFGTVKVWATSGDADNPNTIDIKWVSNSGGSVIEEIGASTLIRHIPGDELDVKLYARGVGKVSINLASYI